MKRPVHFINYQPVTLMPVDQDIVQNFFSKIIEDEILDPTERQFFLWNSSFREESLRHYLNLGWSFGIYSQEKQLLAVILAQALLFVESETQQLWVEDIQAVDDEFVSLLCEFMIRMGKDKHFQSVQFRNSKKMEDALQKLSFRTEIKSGHIKVKTTK